MHPKQFAIDRCYCLTCERLSIDVEVYDAKSSASNMIVRRFCVIIIITKSKLMSMAVLF